MQEVNPNELYNRQREMGLYVPESVTVIGLGGGGSWVAITMALMGVKEIYMLDNDTIEESNLNRTLFRYCDIGKTKSQAVRELILERRPDCRVINYTKTSLKMYDEFKAGLNIEFAEILDTDLIVDATDNYGTRTLLGNVFKEQGKSMGGEYIPYCKLGYDGLNYEIDFSFAPIEDANLQGYRRINTYIGTVMSEVSLLLGIVGTRISPLAGDDRGMGKRDMYNFSITDHKLASHKELKLFETETDRPLQWEGKKLIPLTEEHLEHWTGKRVYVNIPEGIEIQENGLNIPSKNKENKDKVFILTDGYANHSSYQGIGQVRNDQWYFIKYLLLVTDEDYVPEPTPEVEIIEVEEDDNDFVIEEDPDYNP